MTPSLATSWATTPEVAAQFDQHRVELEAIIAADLLRGGDPGPCQRPMIERAAFLTAALAVLDRGARHLLSFGARAEDIALAGNHASAARELRTLLGQLRPRSVSTVADEILGRSDLTARQMLAELPAMGSA